LSTDRPRLSTVDHQLDLAQVVVRVWLCLVSFITETSDVTGIIWDLFFVLECGRCTWLLSAMFRFARLDARKNEVTSVAQLFHLVANHAGSVRLVDSALDVSC